MGSPAVEVTHGFTHQLWTLRVFWAARTDESLDAHRDELTFFEPSEIAHIALGGPSLKALIALGFDIPKRRGAGF